MRRRRSASPCAAFRSSCAIRALQAPCSPRARSSLARIVLSVAERASECGNHRVCGVARLNGRVEVLAKPSRSPCKRCSCCRSASRSANSSTCARERAANRSRITAMADGSVRPQRLRTAAGASGPTASTPSPWPCRNSKDGYRSRISPRSGRRRTRVPRTFVSMKQNHGPWRELRRPGLEIVPHRLVAVESVDMEKTIAPSASRPAPRRRSCAGVLRRRRNGRRGRRAAPRRSPRRRAGVVVAGPACRPRSNGWGAVRAAPSRRRRSRRRRYASQVRR